MKLISQHYEVLTDIYAEKALTLIEKCGRVCYKSEDKITKDSASEFVAKINKNNHESVIEHSMLTVRFVTDRGVSHELVRHRLASFSQESTRYCNYSLGKFGGELLLIRPVWFNYANDILIGTWMKQMTAMEATYFMLLERGLSPQDARSVLPNALKTEIIVTANFREWKHIFKMRALNKAAHPQMRDLMIPLYLWCRKLIPEIFDMGDIT